MRRPFLQSAFEFDQLGFDFDTPSEEVAPAIIAIIAAPTEERDLPLEDRHVAVPVDGTHPCAGPADMSVAADRSEVPGWETSGKPRSQIQDPNDSVVRPFAAGTRMRIDGVEYVVSRSIDHGAADVEVHFPLPSPHGPVSGAWWVTRLVRDADGWRHRLFGPVEVVNATCPVANATVALARSSDLLAQRDEAHRRLVAARASAMAKVAEVNRRAFRREEIDPADLVFPDDSPEGAAALADLAIAQRKLHEARRRVTA